MSFISLLQVEKMKIRRSKILWILFIPVILMWTTAVVNAGENFTMQEYGISPENSFFVQSFMGMTWFMIPATLVVGCVLLQQTERGNRGIVKMRSLPVSPIKMCLAKFVVLIGLLAVQMIFMDVVYFVGAAIATKLQSYTFWIHPGIVLRETGIIFLASIPMAAAFWMITSLIHTLIISVGVGFASIVPSVLVTNTKIWFLYPICYPLYVVMEKYGEMAENLEMVTIQWIPWIPVAIGLTVLCLMLACIGFLKEDSIV